MQNVARLLLARECSGKGSRLCGRPDGPVSTQHQLERWQEADFVGHSSASYCSFQPAPRSTIALSYNSNGTLLASTHGDHTVKITSCATGKLVKVLTGHRRTPWVVRFHPRKPTLLASGSLDHEVRLWDAATSQCIARHTFGKPIASLAFHVSADVLAIACGHKLYIWEYTVPNKLPSIVLKTRRSMRAVHFHPHGHPVVLTAEVQDPSPTPDLSMSLSEAGPLSRLAQAQQQQQQQQPVGHDQHGPAAPAPAAAPSGGWAPNRPPPSQEVPIPSPQLLRGASPGPAGPAAPRAAPSTQQRAQQAQQPRRVYIPTSEGPVQVGPQELQGGMFGQLQQQQQAAAPPSVSLPQARWMSPFGPVGSRRQWAGSANGAAGTTPAFPWPSASAAAAGALGSGGAEPPGQDRPSGSGAGRPDEEQPASRLPGWVPPGSADLPPSMVPLGWELPFPSNLREPFAPGAAGDLLQNEPWQIQGPGNPTNLPHVMAAFSAAAWNIIGEEQPPRVRLRLWRFDAAKPSAPLESNNNLKLQISDAVLCSEMGVHFSPCGRFVAATTACRAPLPQAVPAAPILLGAAEASESDREAVAAMLVDSPSPRPERAVFEVRVYSIDRNSFGEVMMARRIRAAHCLTSVQFSPTCDHLLLAYGKKHISLLRSLVAERGVVVPMHTILEVFRLSDMELVRVLPSGEDEINAACFHPRPGGGIAYGTKEGKLRLVSHDRSKLAAEPASKRTSSDSQASSEGEEHPTERELQGLREWVLTQQWLQQHMGVGGPPPRGPAAAGAVPGQQHRQGPLAGAAEQQALQLLRRALPDAERPG